MSGVPSTFNCIVVCGEWKTIGDGRWRFIVDPYKLSRIIPTKFGMTIEDLVVEVKKEFDEVTSERPNFSYQLHVSPPSQATDGSMPPILFTTDFGLDCFLQELSKRPEVHLCVSFVAGITRNVQADVIPARNNAGLSRRGGFVTPVKLFADTMDTYSSGSRDSPYLIDDDTLLAHTEETEAKFANYVSTTRPSIKIEELDSRKQIVPFVFNSKGPRNKRQYMDTDAALTSPLKFDLIGKDSQEEVRAIEDHLSNNPDVEVPMDKSTAEEQVTQDEEIDSSGEIPVVVGNVDREFWANLIDDEYGGSNAWEVMTETPVRAGKGSGSKRKEEVLSRGMQDYVYRWRDKENGESSNPTDEEQPDIPPMFDDDEFERAPVPDLDMDIIGDDLYTAKLFASKQDCLIWLAIQNKFYYLKPVSNIYKIVIECPGDGCSWHVMVHIMLDTGYWQVRKAELLHSCGPHTRKKYVKLGTTKIIAAAVRNEYSDPSTGLKASGLKALLMKEFRIDWTYNKCWRARSKALEMIRGTDDGSYRRLVVSLHMLKLANPGTIAEVDTEVDEEGRKRFRYMFLAFGASIQGFENLRRMIIVDGTHLSGRYGGVLLTASGHDANFQVFPLAFCVVDSENDDAWTYFFSKLEAIVADSNSLTFISDRCQSIYNAKAKIFPHAHHGACSEHIYRNVKARFKSAGLAQLVKDAAKAWRVGAYRDLYNRIRNNSEACAKYIDAIGVGHWTRAYFRGERYNLMTSNIAETLNGALKEGRTQPIDELVACIRSMMTRWFFSRKKKARGHRDVVSGKIKTHITVRKEDNCCHMSQYRAISAKTHITVRKEDNCKNL